MIRFIFFLSVAILLAIIGVWFAENPGEVLVEWQGWRLETSVGMVLLAAVVLAALATLLFEILRALFVAPGRWMQYRRRRRRLRGFQEITSGLIAAAAGDRRSARLHARQAQKLLPDEAGMLLLDAQSAQLEGNEEHAQSTYRAMLKRPDTEFLALRGLLAQALKNGDRDEALELARRAYNAHPETSWTGSTLFDLLTQKHRWSEALDLVTVLEGQQLADRAMGNRYRAALHLLIGRQQLADNEADRGLKSARQAIRAKPEFAPAAVLGARCATEMGHRRQARRILEKAWGVRPHPDLARAYADLVPEEPARDRLKRFDRVRRRHPLHVETRLTMAELALAAGDHVLARNYLADLVEGSPTVRACRLMAEIEKASGAAPSVVEEWQNRAANAVRDPAWVCEDTGEALPGWQPFSRSGHFGRVVWDTPPTVVALLEDQRPTGFVLARPDSGTTEPVRDKGEKQEEERKRPGATTPAAAQAGIPAGAPS
jgi:HemY protein